MASAQQQPGFVSVGLLPRTSVTGHNPVDLADEKILLTSLVMHPPYLPIFWQGLTDTYILLIFIWKDRYTFCQR